MNHSQSVHEPSIVQLIRETNTDTSAPQNQSHNSTIFKMPETNPLHSSSNLGPRVQQNENHQNTQILGLDILANQSKMHSTPTGTHDHNNNNNLQTESSNTHRDETFKGMDNEEEDANDYAFNEEERDFHVDNEDSDNDNREENMIFDESNEDVITEKRKLLFKIYCMERKGVTLTQKFTMMNSFEELKNEYDRVAHEHNVTSSVAFSRKMLMMSVTAMEYLNSKFDPFDISLDGWSESVHENVTDYDDVFGELYEKYHTKAQIAPEIKLMLMLGGSGFMFHLTNSMFKNSNQMPSMMTNFAGMNINANNNYATNATNATNSQNNVSMRAPIGVDDILSELKNSRDLDSMSDDTQSVISNASVDNKFIKIRKAKRGKRSHKSRVHLDI